MLCVTFYRSASDSNGELYKSPLQTYKFPPDVTEGDAISFAIENFEASTGKPWQEIAEFYELDWE
jgi:hypothetical protein